MAQTTIGMKIRLMRTARKESQAALAKRAGISRVTLTHIENGDSKPDFDTVERIAKALNTKMMRLVA